MFSFNLVSNDKVCRNTVQSLFLEHSISGNTHYTLSQFGFYMQKLNKSFFFSVPPSVAPRNVTALSTTSTSIFLTWDAVPSNQGSGNILGYNVNWTLQSKHDDRRSTAEVSVSMVFVNLTGIRKSRNFSITVFAFSECGDGPRSEILTVRTDEDSKC